MQHNVAKTFSWTLKYATRALISRWIYDVTGIEEHFDDVTNKSCRDICLSCMDWCLEKKKEKWNLYCKMQMHKMIYMIRWIHLFSADSFPSLFAFCISAVTFIHQSRSCTYELRQRDLIVWIFQFKCQTLLVNNQVVLSSKLRSNKIEFDINVARDEIYLRKNSCFHYIYIFTGISFCTSCR